MFETAKLWYPFVTKGNILNTLKNSDVISNEILEYPLKNVFMDTQAPYIDNGDRKIVFPLSMFAKEKTKNLYGNNYPLGKEDEVFAILTIFNGIMVHEIAHALVSPVDKSFYKHCLSTKQISAINRDVELFFDVYNVVEDLFIERKIQELHPDFARFVVDHHEMLRNYEMFDNLVSQYFSEKETRTFLGILVLFDVFDGHEVYKKLFDYTKIISKISLENSQHDRCEIAFELFEKILESGDKRSSQYDVSVIDKAIGFLGNGDLLDLIGDSKSLVEKNNSDKDLSFSIKSFNDYPESITTDNMFASLPKYIMAKDKTKMPNGADVDGPKLSFRDLYRFGTDRRIFNTHEENQRGLGKRDVILLIDGSASMKSIYKSVVNSAFNCFDTLVKSGFNVAAFVHTTNSGCDIYPVAYWGIKKLTKNKNSQVVNDGNYKSLFEKAKGFTNMSANADGIAINAVAALSLNCLVLVFSDGSPSGNGYGSFEGTKEIVERIRKSGKSVYSLSLVQSVVHDNDRLYGKEFNINASGNLNSELIKFLRGI